MTERLAGDEDLYSALEVNLLGQRPYLTRVQVAERGGVSMERAHELWRSLGFPPTTDDEIAFVDTDVEALQTLQLLVDSGLLDEQKEIALSRSMGRSFARLAEWEVAEIADNVLSELGDVDPALVDAVADQALPAMEQLQNYVWRRHLASAAGRLLLRVENEETVGLTVGFADVVGWTRRTRSMTTEELAAMVERFEQVATTTVADAGGRIIKTIGDEVLFVADDPAAAARIALTLAEMHGLDEEFPKVRVGLGHGEVLSRFGDVFGEPVNIASRLTSLARPGRVLCDRGLADVLRDSEEFRVRWWRIVPVKGYSRLEAWAVKRPKAPREHGLIESLRSQV